MMVRLSANFPAFSHDRISALFACEVEVVHLRSPKARVKCKLMPKTRKRRPKKHRRRNTQEHNSLAVDRMFETVVDNCFKVAVPSVLYHYTGWQGAEGIL